MRPDLNQNRHSDDAPAQHPALTGAGEVAGFWTNLAAGFRLALALPVREDAFESRGRSALFLWCAFAGLVLFCEYAMMRPVAGLSPFAATLLAAQLFTMLLALRLAALAVGLGAQSRAFDVRLLPALMLSTLA
ncbi:MAG: hypothetical protein AAF074_18700, partial [Pseudomonadota bacterium]